MQLLSSWKDSLKVFLPANFKLFFLITIKTVLETIKIWLLRWWLLFALYSVVLGFLLHLSAFVQPHSESLNHVDFVIEILKYATLFLYCLIVWTLFLSVRPSVEQKTYQYYLHYSRHGLYVALLYILAYLLTVVLDASLMHLELRGGAGDSFFSSTQDVLAYYALKYALLPVLPLGVYVGVANSLLFSPFMALFVIALLDTRATRYDRSRILSVRIWRLLLHTLPFIVIVTFLWRTIISLKTYFEIPFLFKAIDSSLMVSFLLLVLMEIGIIFLWLVFVSILSNLYTKQVHEHFNRYF